MPVSKSDVEQCQGDLCQSANTRIGRDIGRTSVPIIVRIVYYEALARERTDGDSARRQSGPEARSVVRPFPRRAHSDRRYRLSYCDNDVGVGTSGPAPRPYSRRLVRSFDYAFAERDGHWRYTNHRRSYSARAKPFTRRVRNLRQPSQYSGLSWKLLPYKQFARGWENQLYAHRIAKGSKSSRLTFGKQKINLLPFCRNYLTFF